MTPRKKERMNETSRWLQIVVNALIGLLASGALLIAGMTASEIRQGIKERAEMSVRVARVEIDVAKLSLSIEANTRDRFTGQNAQAMEKRIEDDFYRQIENLQRQIIDLKKTF